MLREVRACVRNMSFADDPVTELSAVNRGVQTDFRESCTQTDCPALRSCLSEPDSFAHLLSSSVLRLQDLRLRDALLSRLESNFSSVTDSGDHVSVGGKQVKFEAQSFVDKNVWVFREVNVDSASGSRCGTASVFDRSSSDSSSRWRCVQSEKEQNVSRIRKESDKRCKEIDHGLSKVDARLRDVTRIGIGGRDFRGARLRTCKACPRHQPLCKCAERHGSVDSFPRQVSPRRTQRVVQEMDPLDSAIENTSTVIVGTILQSLLEKL